MVISIDFRYFEKIFLISELHAVFGSNTSISVGCLWHSHGKNPNQIVQNLYRFLIDLLPLKKVEIRTFLAKFVALEFSHSWFRMAC